MIQEYNTHPALRSVTSHFWKYVPCLQSFSLITTIAFQADATQCPAQYGSVDDLPTGFFAGMEADIDVRNQ
jgi:hypothetical protein